MERLKAQLAAAPAQRWPAGFSPWDGWTGKRIAAKGFSVPTTMVSAGGKWTRMAMFFGRLTRDAAQADLAVFSTVMVKQLMVGEWHFGALDVGQLGSGIARVRHQAAWGQAFRIYTEDAAAKPWCVGDHYFTLYDESALGRFDDENWSIGFLDVCNWPCVPLADAARASHERLYRIALGEVEPYSDEPEYLPQLFL